MGVAGRIVHRYGLDHSPIRHSRSEAPVSFGMNFTEPPNLSFQSASWISISFTKWQSERCDMTCWPRGCTSHQKSPEMDLHQKWITFRRGNPEIWRLSRLSNSFWPAKTCQLANLPRRAATRQCAQHLRSVGAHKDEVGGAKSFFFAPSSRDPEAVFADWGPLGNQKYPVQQTLF